MKIIFFSFLFFLSLNMYAQHYTRDSIQIRHTLDSLHIVLNRPVPPPGYKLYYSCDSTAFMKKINGDTIDIYYRGGYTPLFFTSAYEFNNFSYYISHRDDKEVSYLSKFFEDGRIILENPTQVQFIFRNDSLFERRYNDDAYLSKAMEYGFSVAFGGMDSLEADKKIKEARAMYHGSWEVNLVFCKDMFKNNRREFVIPAALNPNKPRVILLNKWKKNGLDCYHIQIVTATDIGDTKFDYIFNEKMEFVAWEGCDE